MIGEISGREDASAVRGRGVITLATQLRAVGILRSAPVTFAAGLLTLAALAGFNAFQRGSDFVHFWSDFAAILLAIAPVIALITIVVPLASFTLFHLRLSPQQKNVSFLISDEMIRVEDATGAAVTIPWSQVRRFREERHGFIAHLRPYGRRYLMRAAFGDEEILRLRRFIR